MDLRNAYYDSTRNKIVVHGIEYTVKVQRGRYYIHARQWTTGFTGIGWVIKYL